MLRQRLIVAILLLPIGAFILQQGGLLYLAVILFLLGVGAWEYSRIAAATGAQPARWLCLAGTLLIALGAAYPDRGWLTPAIAALLLTATFWHIIRFERGATTPLNDWAATIAGPVYIGLLGGFLFAIRNLPEGLWWTLIVLPAMWFSDSGAYTVGTLFGRHRMSPRVSPNKTWEGLVGGLVGGIAGATLLALLWRIPAGPDSLLTWQHAALLGLLVTLVGTVGDLGISMLKRQVGFKDSGVFLAGHGGALDRIDSWLMAGMIGYFYLVWIVLP